MKFNGLMIDCSRLMEPHRYYFKLLDFMGEWGMNVLLLHFSDDHGFGIRMPGFEKIAMPNAFSAAEIKKLVAHAAKKGVDIIPELETFGHTRFLTDRKEYSHLYAGRKTKYITFNAIDPLNHETHSLMKRLITATAKLFPSKYIHLGCDEVDLEEYCKERNLCSDKVWADYVNKVIGYAKDCGKIPMIWGDHPTKSESIAKLLRKDLIVYDWRYSRTVDEEPVIKLKKYGFKKIISAPSIACWGYRSHMTEIGISNVEKMASLASKYRLEGLITTIWCPYRYFQNAHYYGIAFSAEAGRVGGMPDMKKFKEKFARKVFGTGLTDELDLFLELHPSVIVDNQVAVAILGYKIPPEKFKEIEAMSKTAFVCIEVGKKYRPAKNAEIFNAMLLAVKASWCCMEYNLLYGKKGFAERKRRFNEMLKAVRADASAEWDRTRFKDSPWKYKAQFKNSEECYILILLKKMKYL